LVEERYSVERWAPEFAHLIDRLPQTSPAAEPVEERAQDMLAKPEPLGLALQESQVLV
jgi:hypothetical protein